MAIVLSFSFFIGLMILAGNISSWQKKKHSTEDYLMAGHVHGKLMIALSGAASAASGFIMIGAVGAGYTMGLTAVLMPLGWFLGDYIFWTFFPARINQKGRNYHCETIPEFIGYSSAQTNEPFVRKLLALICVIFLGLYAIGQFLAAGKAVTAVFDFSMTKAIIASGIIIAAYSAKGGLESSIPTQFLQALIMLFTTVGLLLIALYTGQGPMHILEAIQALDPDLLSLSGGKEYLLLTAFVFGFATSAFTFDFGQPHLLVRIMATKSPEEAIKAKWIYLGFMQLTWVSMSLFGLIMTVLLPEIADPEQALPVFARDFLHPILAGAVMAGIFAAVASTLDAQLLVISSCIGVDLLPELYKRMVQRFGVNYHVAVTILVTVITGTLAIFIVGNTTVFTIIIFSASVLGATFGCAMFIAVMEWRSSPFAISVSVIVALITTVAWRFSGLSEFMLEAFPGFLAGLVTHQFLIWFTGKKSVSARR
jgi:sodium/proline symporter